MTSQSVHGQSGMPKKVPAAAVLAATLAALVGCAAPTPGAAPILAGAAASTAAPNAAPAAAYPADIVAREACPARDPDYADYRSRQMSKYRQEAAAA